MRLWMNALDGPEIGLLLLAAGSALGLLFGLADMLAHPKAYGTAGAKIAMLAASTFWWATVPMAWWAARKRAERAELLNDLVTKLLTETDIVDQVRGKVEKRVAADLGIADDEEDPEEVAAAERWNPRNWGG